MYKKAISLITIFLLLSNNIYFITNAVSTNQSSTPWTIEKAEHLAKKTLFWASQQKVNELFNAWNASNAVDILFPSISWPDRTAFDTKMTSILDNSWLIETSKSEMRDFYTVKRMNDPYEAKAKLHGLFEDTFSVNTIRDRINYWDIESTYDLLYSHTLWNYKEMVKRNLYNNWVAWDYSLWEYLDLFNQPNPTRPNENYSREIIQLFLMLEYKPTESEDLWSTKNYTEDDVQALAKILFWFESDENTHMINFNADSNTNNIIEFLDWNLVSWDSFPFYNTASWTVDIQVMKTSISWNNWLPDNTIDYIFSKRQEEIAIFLADKLYRFYIAENPLRSDLDIITAKIIENNFEIFPTVKWLLSNDIIYSEKSMNDVIYKNPLELVIWTSKILGLNSDDLDFRYSLNELWWTPYWVGKIFWRDWYDDNTVFFTPYIANKWTSETSKLASKLIDTNLSFLTEQNSATWIVEELENKLYLWKNLDTSTKQKLINYLNHDKDWNEIIVDFTDNNYVAKNIQGLIYIMLNLPEYVLQSWYDISKTSEMNNDSFYNNDSKLVLIKASWWLDWLHWIIPKNEYSEYLELRWTGSLTWTWIISLDDNYYINSSLTPFKGLYDSWNLKIINRIWTPDHSRGHDSASRKVTSIDNTYEGWKWIFWDFISEEDPSKTIVLAGSTKPSILSNWNYMWIGSSALFKIASSSTSISTDEKEHKITILKDLLINRSYVWTFWETFKSSAIIDSVARDSVANWWREWSGYNMNQRFTFLESLYNNWLWNTSWLRADGWYDTHRNQKDYLNNNLERVANETTDFFNRVKNNYNVTIVIYSEFWRTNKLNASNWVDHGMAGWMFIISNNEQLTKTELPEKIYWNLSFKNSKSNWLWVWIDYRTVYSSIYKALYNKDISSKLWAEYNINNYIENSSSQTQTLWYDHKQYSSNRYYTHLKFNVDDINFLSSQWSHIKFEYWTDTDGIKEISRYTLDRSRLSEKDYDISIRTNGGIKYYYKMTIYDNQFNERIINWSFFTPDSEENISTEKSVFIPRFKNIDLSNNIQLSNSSTWIILSGTWEVEYIGENNIKLLSQSWTYITEIEWVSSDIWNWVFLNPTEININNFIGNSSIFKWDKLLNYRIKKLLKVWASTLWVWLKLNKDVLIEIPNFSISNDHIVITSEDWINWNEVSNSNLKITDDTVSFNTNHFSYFAIIEDSPIINDEWEDENSENEDSNTNEDDQLNDSSTSYSRSSGGSSTPRQIKDNCPYWDFSASYYDNTCWIDPYLMHPSNQTTWSDWMYLDMYNDLKSGLENLNTWWLSKEEKSIYRTEYEMELAYIELKIVDEEKAEIYENILKDNSILDWLEKDSKIALLILLREKMSSIFISWNKLIHIKDSKLNNTFEKIWRVIIKKNFSEAKTKELFNILNKVVIYYAINEIELLEKTIKEKNLLLLKDSIKKLVNKFREKKTIIVPVKKVETIREKIIRINAKKKASINSMK